MFGGPAGGSLVAVAVTGVAGADACDGSLPGMEDTAVSARVGSTGGDAWQPTISNPAKHNTKHKNQQVI